MLTYQLEFAAPWIIPLFGALACSGRIVAYLVQELLQETLHLPAWLEALAPLKGRWLGVLLSSPALALVFFLTLIGVYLPLTFLAHTAWPLGLIASLGLLGLCLIRPEQSPDLRC